MIVTCPSIRQSRLCFLLRLARLMTTASMCNNAISSDEDARITPGLDVLLNDLERAQDALGEITQACVPHRHTDIACHDEAI